ncbi:Unannotated [Lentimonas sp. CC19]|nr:Unannotated [Lentimonas sp. CC10]CAA6696143.1 Unannotated [Lentimonas sp. CC19]CAA7071631.1 Unannotated [Lentimonas sp. CC11]
MDVNEGQCNNYPRTEDLKVLAYVLYVFFTANFR